MKPVKKLPSRKPTWLLVTTEPGLSDIMCEQPNRLSFEQFNSLFTKRLDQNDHKIERPEHLVKSLHKIAMRGLRFRRSLPEARKRTKTADWKRRQSLLKQFIRAASTAKLTFRTVYEPKEALSKESGASRLARSVVGLVDDFFDDLIEQLKLVERLMKNERAVVSGYLKPTVNRKSC